MNDYKEQNVDKIIEEHRKTKGFDTQKWKDFKQEAVKYFGYDEWKNLNRQFRNAQKDKRTNYLRLLYTGFDIDTEKYLEEGKTIFTKYSPSFGSTEHFLTLPIPPKENAEKTNLANDYKNLIIPYTGKAQHNIINYETLNKAVLNLSNDIPEYQQIAHNYIQQSIRDNINTKPVTYNYFLACPSYNQLTEIRNTLKIYTEHNPKKQAVMWAIILCSESSFTSIRTCLRKYPEKTSIYIVPKISFDYDFLIIDQAYMVTKSYRTEGKDYVPHSIRVERIQEEHKEGSILLQSHIKEAYKITYEELMDAAKTAKIYIDEIVPLLPKVELWKESEAKIWRKRKAQIQRKINAKILT